MRSKRAQGTSDCALRCGDHDRPIADAAWRHLGYKKQGSRWVKPEDAVAAKNELTRQKHADKLWKTKLEALRHDMESKDAAKRAKAEQGLDRGDRPASHADDLGDFCARRRTAANCRRADDGPHRRAHGIARAGRAGGLQSAAEVRRRAIETLTRRDPRDVVGRLISLIHKPFKYQVRHVIGPGGRVSSSSRVSGSILSASMKIRHPRPPFITAASIRRMSRLIHSVSAISPWPR